jgi:cell envelope opacity-associated protein A
VLPIAPAATVDYGPLSPSPVVVLPAIEAQPASQPKPAAGKPAQKKTGKPKSGKTQGAPKKNRVCWSNGKVTPC